MVREIKYPLLSPLMDKQMSCRLVCVFYSPSLREQIYFGCPCSWGCVTPVTAAELLWWSL